MKKICIFNSYYPFIKGGAEYQAKMIAQQLRGHYEVFFISYGHLKDEIIYDEEIKIYCLSLNSKIDRITLYHYSARKIEKILKKEHPEIIYQRILNSYSYHLGNLSKKYRINLFIHIADNYCLEFDSSLRSKVRYYLFKKIRKLYQQKTIHFITQTSIQNSLLESHCVTSSLQFYNIHPEPQYNISEEKRFGSKKIVWIGSVRKVKNFELFLRLVEDLKEEDFSFVMLGRFENTEYSLRLQEKAKSFDNLQCLGEVDNSEVNRVLSESFLLVNTSFSEGFSNTFIQAWLRGVPVISYIVNPDNLFDDKKLGICCNNQYNKLRNCLNNISQNYTKYIKMSEECMSFSKEHFLVEKNMKLLFDLLSK